MRFTGQVAVVTGAGRNIGEAVAWKLAEEGARVAVVDLDPGRGQRVAEAIGRAHPGQAMAVVCDVSDRAQVQEMVDTVLRRWGRVDVLVNNAAITDRETILTLSEEEWDRVIDVSLKSVFLVSQAVARHMVERGGGGCIINLASTSGHRGRSNATAYTAAKAGILNLTRTMAIQLAPWKIRVNSVTPNRVGSPVGMDEVRTDKDVQNLVGRAGVPMDIAQAVAFLASGEAAFITAADLLVDGGALSVTEP